MIIIDLPDGNCNLVKNINAQCGMQKRAIHAMQEKILFEKLTYVQSDAVSHSIVSFTRCYIMN